MMKFDSSNTETFTVDGTEFQFNTDRIQYIAEEQIDHYGTRIEKLAKNLRRKRIKNTYRMTLLHSIKNGT